MPVLSGSGLFEFRGDTDWHRVRLTAGTSYVINISASNTSIYLLLPDGTRYRPPIEFTNQITFVAPVTGDYFVVAENWGAAAGTGYSISVQDFVDTIPASTATTEALSVGGSVTQSYGFSGPYSDWYSVSLTAGQSYQLASNNSVDRVYFVDATGSVVAIEGGNGLDRAHFTPTTSGTYYVGISTPTSYYTLSLNAVTDDHGTSPALAGSLTVGTPTAGTLESPCDDDWFAVTLTAGQSYRLLVDTGTHSGPGKFVEVYDATGALLLQQVNGFPSSPETIFTPTTTGTYYVSAGIRGSNSGIGYTISATAIADLADNISTTGTMAIGGTTAGTWQGPGDRDWYAITLTAGASYSLGLSSSVDPIPSSGPNIAIYDGAGALIPLTIGNGPGISITHFTAPTTGTYYVSASVPLYATGTFSYTVSASVTADDLPNNVTTTGTIAVGGLATGNADDNMDADWFAVTLVAGVNYRIESPNQTSGVAIRNAAGQLLTLSSWGDEVFSPTVSGTYYLEATGYGGAYTVRITTIATDIVENNTTFSALRESFIGTTGPDTFNGVNEQHESFVGSDGNDLFFAGAGYDLYNGGVGIDTISFANYTVGANVSLQASSTTVGGLRRHTITQIENVVGSAFDDAIFGSGLANQFDMSLGGVDIVDAGGGDDAIIFGSTLTAADIVDGGGGTDQVGISGNYTGANALVLGATTLTKVEVLAALPGGSYDITLNDGNTAAGGTFTVFGGNLGVGESFTVDASAETDGNIITYGGLGTDTILGGGGNDGFYFGPNKYGVSDTVTGGAGTNDQLALDGDYTLTITSREDVEVLALLRGPVGTPNTFNITVADSFTPTGQTRIIWGGQLLTSLTIDASAETGGNLIFFGGTQSDTLTGGAGSDTISAGGGGDALRGGLGNDIFRYSDLGDSNSATNATRDRILDFASGDLIDLSGIDAITGGSDDAFAFIGSGAFTNVAGQLRSVDNGNGTFTIEGDVNGDGLADLAILVTAPAPLGAGDFVL
jgi:Ca2+-binding RTX toxin-like protein